MFVPRLIKNIKTMRIEEFLNNGTNVSITVTPIDLKEFAMYLIEQAQVNEREKAQEEQFLTPDEVSAKIGVSTNTLWRWEKSGYLVPVKVGRKSRYKLSEVNALLAGRSQQEKPATGNVTGKIWEDLL